MENPTSTSASMSEKCLEVIFVHYRLHNFCINEGCPYAINSDEIQGISLGLFHMIVMK